MSISLTGAEGLFTRIGRCYDAYKDTVTNFGAALNTAIEDIRDEYETGNEASALDGIYALRDSYRGVHTGYLSGLTSIAQKTVIDQTHRDHPLLSKTLANALTELIRQMKASGDDILRPTVSTAVAAFGSNIGDAVICSSVTNEFGDQLDMIYDEDINLKVTSDSASGSTQYQETLTVTGEPKLPATDYLWPGGSGATGTLTLFDAAVDNLISNADFDDWTDTNTPDDWTIVTGTAGTQILRNGTEKVRGDYGLQIDSDGSTLTTIKQQLSTSLVKPNKVYCLNCWVKTSSLDANGVVRFRLTDGAGTTLTNDAGTSLTYNRNTNGEITTSFTQVTTFFQTKRQLPSTGVFLEIGLTTSPAASINLYFDLIGLAEATQLYSGGPWVKGFSKTTANAKGDYYTLTAANNATTSQWVRAAQRLFDLPALGSTYYLPSVTSSESIADSLLA